MVAVPAVPSPGGLRGAIDLAPLVARQAQAARQTSVQDSASSDQPTSRVVVEVGDAEFGEVVELSRTVPVVVALVDSWSSASQQLIAALRRIVEGAAGRLVLALVDSDASPQITQALQPQSVPTVLALIGGRPVPLFAGAVPEEQLQPLFEQVLELAAQNGVTGSVPAEKTVPAVDAEPERLPPLHAEALDAIDRQDYAAAAGLYRTAIAQDPRDSAAVAALSQVELLDRLDGTTEAVRSAAAADPKDVSAALAVADLDIAGGAVDEAFGRLLDAFSAADPDGRTIIRTRLLDYFVLIGADDPRVTAARRRLAMLLY